MKQWQKIILAVLLGTLIGLQLENPPEILTLAGQLFIRLLKMLVGPIIFSSLVTGICHINDPKRLTRIGIRTLGYFLASTLIAITTGVCFGLVLEPGNGLQLPIPEKVHQLTTSTLSDFVFSIIPENPFTAFSQGNVLQIIVFGTLFALAIPAAHERGGAILTFIESINDVMYTISAQIMKLAPYGVFALIATSVSSIGIKVIIPLFQLLLANYICCLFQVVVVFGLTLRVLAKVRIAPYFRSMKDAIILAFTTCSSAATLPLSLEAAKKKLGISPDIAGFVLSLGSTINMNGAAIGQALAAIFIAQAYQIEITPLKIAILYITTLLAAIGAAGIPGSGILMLSVVLNAMGLPLEGIALVAGIDRIREMVSTVTNILGDTVTALYVARAEQQLDEVQYYANTSSAIAGASS